MSVGTLFSTRSNVRNVFMRTFMYGMVGSLAMLISSWEKADRMRDRYLEKNRDYGDTYDFIVVGAGTAGSLVANRLSADYKVLLLEAGGDPHPFQSIPLMANFMSNYEEVDWMHKTVPQKHACFGSVGNQAGISQGKSLGGTSNLDYMMYLRGSPQDYDNWANSIGDQSWAYSSMMEYFKKHENYDGPWKDKKYHGTQGEINLAVPTYTGIGATFCNAGKEMGYKYMDLNSPFSEGFDMSLYPTRRGYRHGVFKAFIQSVSKNRWNLDVHKYSHVNQILFRGPHNEAYGVEYDRHGKRRTAFAKKEVILSAGAIQSPKILMLSGVGPAEHLAALGIPVKVNLPHVGTHLQDHLAVQVGPFYTDSKATLLLDRDLTGPAVFRYAMSNGPLTTTGYEASALLTSDTGKLTGRSNWPDTLLMMNGLAHHESSDEDFAHAHRFRRDLMKNYWAGSKGVDSFSIGVSASRPKSRGFMKLQDANPYSPVVIDPRYLEQIEDVGVMVDGIKKVMRMAENTLTFEKVGAKFTNQSVPGCTEYRFKSDDYWSCFVRLMSFSMGDVAGTLGMGRVVDGNLSVYGVQRLRVIDASVMPEIVSAGTSAATLAIGEKGAHMILQLWGGADKVKSIVKESKNVQNILQESANKLKEDQDTNTFWNAIKDTPSFRQLPGVSNLTVNKSPVKLIGALLENSVRIPGEEYKESIPDLPLTFPDSVWNIPPTKEPVYITTSLPVTVPTNPTPSTTKRPRMESLFQESSSYITYPLTEVVQTIPILSGSIKEAPKKEVTPTPYVLSPQPFFDPPLAPKDIQNDIRTSSFFIPKTTTKSPVSFRAAVDSIVSKTLPILNSFSNSKKPYGHTPELYSFLNRRETERSTTPKPPTTPVTSTTPKTTSSRAQNFVPKVVQSFPQPARSVLEPFSKIVNRPFEGIFKRIRSILKPVAVTTRKPMLTQEDVLGITFPSVSQSTQTTPVSVAASLKTVGGVGTHLHKYWSPTSSKTIVTTTTSKPKTVAYDMHQTNVDNTFKYRMPSPLILVQPNVSASERPPVDYELMEDADTLGRPVHTKDKSVTKTSPPSKPLMAEDIRVIYQRPTSSSPLKESLTLAQNVQELLKSFDTNSPSSVPVAAKPLPDQMYHSYYLDNPTESKTLRDEIDKLMSTSSPRNNSQQLYVYSSSGRNNSSQKPSFTGSLITQRPSVRTSIKDLLQDSSLYKTVHEGQASKDAISSTNLLETHSPLNSSSPIIVGGRNSNKNPLRSLAWPPPPSKTYSSPSKPTSDRDNNLSFRIKILNQ